MAHFCLFGLLNSHAVRQQDEADKREKSVEQVIDLDGFLNSRLADLSMPNKETISNVGELLCFGFDPRSEVWLSRGFVKHEPDTVLLVIWVR